MPSIGCRVFDRLEVQGFNCESNVMNGIRATRHPVLPPVCKNLFYNQEHVHGQ
ncbi:MAG: hypothetical protein BWX80_02860 [Candidatus Hydrogenedentes bacterium ADurb.Bin101]|nr:MAG: hypothetical protein BWX80_02860 [Candidatus Hydrogenedentes bacterium ADurb.Bin101]